MAAPAAAEGSGSAAPGPPHRREAEALPCEGRRKGGRRGPFAAGAMDRYVLLLRWGERRGEGAGAAGTAANMYQLLKASCDSSANADLSMFPACSVAGIPGPKKWYFASHVICGYYQFCSSDWEEINADTQKNEDSLQTNIDECLGAIQNFEEDDSNSRESLSMTDIYDEAAESLHQLADKLPAPGRAMVDVILQAVEQDGPKLKDCLPAIGALKHLREWHSAQITIAANDSKGWQKIADYLSADFVSSDNVMNIIDRKELWRGKIHIWERKFGSEVRFPEFCMKSTSAKTFSTSHLSSFFAVKRERQSRNTDALPEVFHYYGPALEFLQMVVLSDLPSFFISDLEFELSLARKSIKETSTLLLDQISFVSGKVGALFTLPCSVSSVMIPSPAQLSTKKWKEYMARKPKVITVPEIELKGELCRYYFLLQGNGSGGCKATLIHSASQINGTAALAAVNGKLKTKTEERESSKSFHIADFIKSLPHFCGEEILEREKKLSRLQVFALKEYFKRKELTKQRPVISTDEFKNLLELTRECFLDLCNTSLPKPVLQKVTKKTASCAVTSELDLMEPNPMEWPERHVLQNFENFEKNKQKMSISVFAHSSEQLLGHKDSQRESLTLLDAKELLKYFTPEGLPVGDLQPLRIPKRENSFLLTPELTPRKLRGLPFEKAAGCHYHGLEYCLDNRRALERDVGYAELQTRLIRYETQTTCTKECCPVPVVLSPLPSPAVLSEPGSVPDGESLQSEFKTEASRLKCRSKDLDCFYPKKRLTKSKSTDSLLSQASGSSGSHHTVAVPRKRSERSVSLASMPLKQPGQPHNVTTKAGSASRLCATKSKTSKPAKEPRSQKHTRMLKEVVADVLQKHGIAEDHKCFVSCSQRLFEISKFYLKDLKTSRGLLDEMKKTANNNAKQVIEWVLEKTGK
ncbi:mdm2-binding protein isoform X2 [Falco peregrinus]|uniref:mdm2-binding protein isoform X2 n=1 Tax=Falco peregrinus TaxID=8954 RepID=UPI00247AFF50|nr:mdm2-binding protein isoform X2 [Falco peregrinus]